MTLASASDFMTFASLHGLGAIRLDDFGLEARGLMFPPIINLRHYLNVEWPYVSAVGGMAYLHLGYINENRRRGAISGRQGSTLCAGIYTTTAWQFLELASICVLQPDFFPEIGNPSLSERGLSLLEKNTVWGFYSERFSDTGRMAEFMRSIKNKDLDRYFLAQLLVHLMLEWYWFHEVGHCVMGHLDYFRDTFGVEEIDEDLKEEDRVRPDQAHGDRLRCRMLFEKAADAHAFEEMLRPDNVRTSNINGQRFGFDEERMLELRILAMHLVMYLLIWAEFGRRNRNDFESGLVVDHPHSVERYMNFTIFLDGTTNPPTAEQSDRLAMRMLDFKELDEKLFPRVEHYPPSLINKAADRAAAHFDILESHSGLFEAPETFLHLMHDVIQENKRKLGEDDLFKKLYGKYMYEQWAV